MKWEKVKLGDIADFSNGINFDKSAYAEGVKLIGVSNFGDLFFPPYYELAEVKKNCVRDTDYLTSGDIVFVRSNGNKELVGRCMLVSNPPFPVTYSGFCIRCRIKEQDKYNPVFCTYYFKSKGFRHAMSGSAVGANIQNLNQKRLSAHQFMIPDIDGQMRIATILSAYDNLIENNQKQIKLLEEAAQRLYQEWFVKLRFPGHEKVKVVDGVPEGWRHIRVSDLGDIVTGKTPPTSNADLYGGDIPFVKIPDMHGVVFPIKTEVALSRKGADTQKGKYIPANSIIVSCIATVGLVNITTELCQTNQQINAIVPSTETDLYYIYFTMKRLKSLLDGVGSNGATMTNVNKTKFGKLEILYPERDSMKKYFEICKPIFYRILSLSMQNEFLAEARDRLLPKLMSGEIEV